MVASPFCHWPARRRFSASCTMPFLVQALYQMAPSPLAGNDLITFRLFLSHCYHPCHRSLCCMTRRCWHCLQCCILLTLLVDCCLQKNTTCCHFGVAAVVAPCYLVCYGLIVVFEFVYPCCCHCCACCAALWCCSCQHPSTPPHSSRRLA